MLLATFICLIFFIRIYVTTISKKHEKTLISEGAKEYYKGTTTFIIIVHVLYYISLSIESYLKFGTNFSLDKIAYLGITIYSLSFLVLYLSVRNLKKYWTVKVYVAPKHEIIDTGLFKYIKHPIYYLNIAPELIALVLIFKSYISFVLFVPLYLILLQVRIKQEEKVLNL